MFKPSSPEDFATAARQSLNDIAHGPSHRKQTDRPHRDQVEEGPPAKSVTLILFYLLVAVTIAMGAWALISILG